MGDKIFISYSRSDGEFALRLARDLRAANVEVWLDQLDIRIGDKWDRVVERALRECKSLLMIVSPRSVDSDSVGDEVFFAREQGKRVIPVIHEKCELPFWLTRLQHEDFTASYPQALSKLILELGGTAPRAEAASPQTSAFSSRIQAPAPPPGGTRPAIADRTPAPESRLTPVTGASKPPAAESRPILREPVRPLSLSRDSRLTMAFWIGLAGTLVAMFIAAGSPSEDVVGEVVLSILSGVLWASAGAIAGPRRIPLLSAAILSLLVFGSGALSGADLRAVFVVLCPAGAVVGAAVGADISSRDESVR